MNYGFIKTAAAVPCVRVGDIAFNLQQTQRLLLAAAEQHIVGTKEGSQC